jgi:hypothetical protein
VKRPRQASGLSGQPAQARKALPGAKTARSRGKTAGAIEDRGPGGLGYHLALEDEERERIDWHGEQHLAPVRRG